ncbi:S26 family signal peptidase [Catenulispora yoronensis]
MSLAATAVCAALAAAAVRHVRRRTLVVTVTGPSMEPTLHEGDRLLARRVPLARIRIGDVVVIGSPDLATGPDYRSAGGGRFLVTHPWVVKRAAAVPGDPVPKDRVPALSAVPEQHVPPGKLVLLGDGALSMDSRQLGYYSGDGQLLAVMVRKLSNPRSA